MHKEEKMVEGIKATELSPSEYQEWLRTLYEQAWQQYDHEDNLYQSRNTLFLGLQAALIGILTSVSASLISIEPLTIRSFIVPIGLAVLGFLATVFAILGLFLTQAWESITHAARAYLSLRLSTARIIELQSGMDKLGLVGIENRWSTWSRENQEQISRNPALWYQSGFVDTTGKQYEIRPRPRSGGFDVHLRIVKLVKVVWYFFGFIGLLLFGGTLSALIWVLMY